MGWQQRKCGTGDLREWGSSVISCWGSSGGSIGERGHWQSEEARFVGDFGLGFDGVTIRGLGRR